MKKMRRCDAFARSYHFEAGQTIRESDSKNRYLVVQAVFSGCSVKETRRSGGPEIRIARFRILTIFGIFIPMIKLKLLLEDWAGGMFDYDVYSQSSPEEKIHMAVTFLQSTHAKRLTPAEVYHIILSLPRENIRDVYEMSKRHLTPEQLADTKQQIDLFYEMRAATI